MAQLWICLASAAAALTLPSPALADPPIASPAPASFNPRAHELFDRDAELRAWAVRIYDLNRDGWLTLFEVQPAVAAFKDIADGDRDGRVSTWEYARAKEYIAARW